jgi:AcrR family transcriptional regulator
MPGPSSRKERILAAATELFATKGYRATSVAEIERRAGLKPGSGGLYRHFSSKDALLVEVVEGYRSRLAALRARLAALRARLGDELEALVGFLASEQAVVRVGAELSVLPMAVRQAFGAAWDEAHQIFAEHFERRGHPSDEARILGVAALGELAHYMSHLRSFKRAPLDIPVQRYVGAWLERWGKD